MNHDPYQQPRRQNHNAPGCAHELTFSCYHGFKFLQGERTRQWLAESIEQARVRHHFQLWAYVFMPEHAHLIVYPTQTNYDVAEIRKAIKAPVGRKAIEHLSMEAPDWIPRITRKRGKRTERLFWQSGGGFDRNIVQPKTLTNMIRYIHANPVRRGLVGKPEQWRWSSAAWYFSIGWLELIGIREPESPDGWGLAKQAPSDLPDPPIIPDPIPPGWLL